MAFFTKLKDRLFKSSSKLEDGLDAIVAEGADDKAEDKAAVENAAAPEAASEAVSEEPQPVAEEVPTPLRAASSSFEPLRGCLCERPHLPLRGRRPVLS